MKISYEWLKDYVDINKTPEELAEDLSLFGHEVESVEKFDACPERSRGDDYVLDLEITPNRGDCLSILGIAREIAALYNVNLKSEKLSILRSIEENDKNDKKVKVEISDPEICPRFTARVIDNIEIKESPKWIQEKLATYGFRPINNIVDVTNYVMVATGQPLHAFDYDKIKDGQMNIRQAKQGEEVMTLDGKNHILPDGAIIIEDNDKIYDLAGIMGGIKSEVDGQTKTIVLQGAIFDPILIRRASKSLNHTTDASYRYERGVDFEGTVRGVDMAASLIKESCPNAMTGELIDKEIKRPEDKKIEIDIIKVNKLLGTNIDLETAKEYLERLGFKLSVIGNRLSVQVPSYRNYDVKIWQDVAEEVARIYGYNKIEKAQISKLKTQNKNQEWLKREAIKDILKEIGFTEIYSYSFADKKILDLLGENKNLVEMANPLSPETQYLRPSLLPSLITQIAKNPWAPEINVFEIEKVFDKSGEKWQIGIATVGKSDGLIKKAVEILKIDAEIKNVDQKILDEVKIRRPVKYIVIDIDNLALEIEKNIDNNISQNKFQKVSQYPPTVRDLAFLVEKNVSGSAVEAFIKPVSQYILLVELFDDFLLDKLAKKNLAFHIWLQDLEKPMDEKDVDDIIQTIIKEVEQKFKGKLRS